MSDDVSVVSQIPSIQITEGNTNHELETFYPTYTGKLFKENRCCEYVNPDIIESSNNFILLEIKIIPALSQTLPFFSFFEYLCEHKK
jgi:hypothetical protein